jgi:pre-mRNA-splicing helicase BRR2
MSEDFVRQRQYEYRQNSNLVLEPERESRRNKDEATGEVESFAQVGISYTMGDLVRRGGRDLDKKLQKFRTKRSANTKIDVRDKMGRTKRARKEASSTASSLAYGGRNSVLSETQDLDSVGYRPKTKKTSAAYEALLGHCSKSIGDVPHDILAGAADEVLAILKESTTTAKARQQRVEDILGKLKSEHFNDFVNIANLITDYSTSSSASGDGIPRSDGAGNGDDSDDDERRHDALDENLGVAVVFDELDEDGGDEDADVDEVREDEDGDDDDLDGRGVEARSGVTLTGAQDDDIEEKDKLDLDVKDIDAHWLQRELGKFYEDANVSQKLAADVLGLITIRDERECENKLVMLLDFDKFEFIKLLLRNRSKIMYCTRLKQAQDDAQRELVEEEMRNDVEGGGPAILEALYETMSASTWAKDKTAAAARKTRLEARSILQQQQREQDGRPKGGSAHTSVIDVNENDGLVLGSKMKPESVIDLNSVAFQEGSRVMSTTKCNLPAKSWRVQKKGYEEVHVPALKHPDFEAGESLRKIKDIPQWAQPAFKGMAELNRLQSRVYDSAFTRADNLLICAPTGAGKTNVAMLTMLHELGRNMTDSGKIDKSNFKIVYVAPMKALVQETVINFGRRLKPFGITVAELSGDVSLTRQQITDTQVIVTTPEKWDIITRKSGDRTYTQLVRLVIIDEIHLLHDVRGAVLESLIARTLRQVETTQEHVRLVGLSATLPNYEDVATLLRVKADIGLFHFDNSYRPVPLQQQYIGITEKKPLKRFNLMNQVCYEKVMEQAGTNQVLIFVHARKETSKTARALLEMATDNDELSKFTKNDLAIKAILDEQSVECVSSDLKELMPCGIGIHHAGLQRKDRTLVEELFADGSIQVLVCTATLAWGVNLPAHAVIIKGTQIYDPEKGKWVELSYLDIMQMLGRAGRPQYDTEGLGIIITTNSELQYYLSLMNEQLPVESQYVSRLADNLNAEIVMGSVQNLSEAVVWLSYTYLYVRMLQSPQFYEVDTDYETTDPTLEQHRLNLVHSAAMLLAKHQLIRYDRKSGTFQSTPLGRVASHYYISYPSIATFHEHLKPSMSEIELFRLFSLSYEFRHVVVRQEEKQELRKLLERVPVPIKEGMNEPSAKINALLQAYVSRLRLEGFGMAADMVFVQQSAGRILRALFEITVCKRWAGLANKVLQLCKMVDKRMWASQTPLRQFTTLPKEILKKIEKKSIAWDRYYDLQPQDIGELIRHPKMGKKVHTCVHQFPRIELAAHVQPITRSVLKVELTITPDFAFNDNVHGWGEAFHVMVEDVDGEHMLHHEMFMLKKKYADEEHVVVFTVPVNFPLPPQYFIRVSSDRWLQSESILPISFRHLILPDKYAAPKELLDLQPLPVSGLRFPAFEALYNSRPGRAGKQFNAVQTQVFNTCHETDGNVLLCAPAGSGKIVAAEFALLRLFKHNASGRAVFVAPTEALCQHRYQIWGRMFGDGLKKRVVKLTGETAADLKLMAKGDVIIATPTQWDVLSRRWKQRSLIKTVSLFIVSDLHLIGGAEGPTMEIIVSRMRYIAAETKNSMRIVALSAPVANAKDLGDWMGASANGLFNFPLSVRPVPLEIHIQGFNMDNVGARLLAMSKPVFNSILIHAPEEPAIVFVPGRRQAQLTAIDLQAYATAAGKPQRFVHNSEIIQAAISSNSVLASNTALVTVLAGGVAFFHDGLSDRQKSEVLRLFRSGAVQVLVSTYKQAWIMDFHARLVTVMDTCFYDGREHRYVDYPITDMLQMLGRAGRDGEDDCGKCMLLCHSPKKEYYKKFLNEPLPVESHLDHCLHDHLNAEIVTKTIENKQDAIDYLTWTFIYRRILRNPNYYNLDGRTNQHLSDHLSEMVESTVEQLAESNCISVKDEMFLSPLNLGMIAAYYYIQYTSIELFASSISHKSKLKGLLQILSSASEYLDMPVRAKEQATLQRLARHLPVKLDPSASYFKTSVLLQAHFSRTPLTADLRADQRVILSEALRLLQAMVDVVSSSGWLKPALAAMELSQMIVQARWASDDGLLQVPHFNKDIVERLQDFHKNRPKNEDDDSDDSDEDEEFGVVDILELEDDERDQLLKLNPSQMSDVARFCNAYPMIDFKFDIIDAEDVSAGAVVEVLVQLERDLDDDDDDDEGPAAAATGAPQVFAPHYPKGKTEGWWVVIGNTADHSLLSISRTAISGEKQRVKLEFVAPDKMGKYELMVYLVSDAYLRCDQEYPFTLDVKEGGDDSDSEDDDESDTASEASE